MREVRAGLAYGFSCALACGEASPKLAPTFQRLRVTLPDSGLADDTGSILQSDSVLRPDINGRFPAWANTSVTRDPIKLRWQLGDDLRGVRAYAILWTALLVISGVIIASPLPIALANPLLSVTIATTGGIAGLAVLQLDLVRFSTLGHLADLYMGLAFGTFGLANLVVRVLVPVGLDQPHIETTLDLHLLARGAAAILLLTALATASTVIPPAKRARLVVRVGSGVAALLLVGGSAIVLSGSNLPSAVLPATRALLESDSPILEPLAGQEPWLLMLRVVIVVLLGAATLGNLRLSLRLRDQIVARRALALSMLAFGQGHALLIGPVPADYVSTADAFRLVGYVILLYALVARVRSDIAEHATTDERLRLSREIHDGLAQQLTLLQLRLSLARDPARSELARVTNLDAAERLLEGAVLEVRGAITTLRSGLVSWSEFTRTVGRFATEFERNHEVPVSVQFNGKLEQLTSELQLDILRMLHEASSNAVRHGGATQIEIECVAIADDLSLRVRDNGHGFDLDAALRGGGVGLNSMIERLQKRSGTLAVQSIPGQGATLHMWLPQVTSHRPTT